MSLDTCFGADAGRFREMFEIWQTLAPLRDKAGKIDWQKVKEFIETMLPLLLAVLDLFPKKPA
jgi:hypothetical protein